jgi:integrase
LKGRPAGSGLPFFLSRAATGQLALLGRPGAPRPRRVLFATSSGRRLLVPDVWRLIRWLARAVGLPQQLVGRIGAHGLRHSFAILYLNAGGGLRGLQDAMGHQDPRTTRRYNGTWDSLDRSPGTRSRRTWPPLPEQPASC